jgi:hypothetical protein
MMNKTLGTIAAATLLTGSLCLVQAQESNPNAETRIRAAVAAGTMTPEEGRAKLQATRKAMADQSDPAAQRTPREIYASTDADLRKAVAAGSISEADAKARLDVLRKRLAAQAERQP